MVVRDPGRNPGALWGGEDLRTLSIVAGLADDPLHVDYGDGLRFDDGGSRRGFRPEDLRGSSVDRGDGLVDVTVIHGLRDAGEASQGGGRCVVQVAAGN